MARIDVRSIVDGEDVEVWTVVVDILSPLNVALSDTAMPSIAVDGMHSNISKIVIFTKI